MAKKDAVSKRLVEQIAVAKRIKARPKEPPSLLDMATPKEKEELAASLDEKSPFVRPIFDAFKAFGLDHRDIGDWHSLAAHLAHVLFARGQRGRQKKWTDERLCQLLADVAAYKRKRPKAADTAICCWLQRKESYRQETSGALRRALRDARNPKRNSELAQMADFVVRRARGNWTGALDEADRAEGLNWVIENADKLWKPGK